MQTVFLLTFCLAAVTIFEPVASEVMADSPCTLPGGGHLEVGKTGSPSPCMHCACMSPGQPAICAVTMCGMPSCSAPLVVAYRDDVCCPICALPETAV